MEEQYTELKKLNVLLLILVSVLAIDLVITTIYAKQQQKVLTRRINSQWVSELVKRNIMSLNRTGGRSFNETAE